jgi:prepilin-type N-terminal cleavage/methylation domain-containing protein
MWRPPRRRHPQCSTSRSSGFSLLELVVSIALIGVFLGVLLDRLLYYQEAAEKAVMELEATKLKLGLQIYIGDLIARNRPLDFTQIARENPMRWLETPVVGYRGEFSGAVPVVLPKSSWYFDRSKGELVYLVKLDRYFRPVSDGPTRVRWRVRLVRPEGPAARDNTVVGLQLVPVQPYRWF